LLIVGPMSFFSAEAMQPEPLVRAVARIGLPAGLLGVRGGGSGLRLTGRRWLGRLVELVGQPSTPSAEPHWPTPVYGQMGEFSSRA
jgi:hypothetical protein